MREIRADLHMHGPIGFQPYWLKVQGYAGKNLLQLIADRCFEKQIGICAITSQADEVARKVCTIGFGVCKKKRRRFLEITNMT